LLLVAAEVVHWAAAVAVAIELALAVYLAQLATQFQ
jgi:hypothetical protein